MKNLDYIDFEINGQEVSIEFNDPHWSDCESNFLKCINGVYYNKNGKPISYKNDLVD